MKNSRNTYPIPTSDKAHRQKRIVADWLRTKGAVIGVLNVIPVYEQEKYLTLGLGPASTISGRLTADTNVTWASIDHFEVSKNLRGRGIGTRLLKAYVVECKQNGASFLWSDGVSNEALAVRRAIFGDAALNFYDCQHPDAGFLPLTVKQVALSNQRIDTLDITDPERREPQGHVGICVDLSAVDTIGWESPNVLVDSD